MTSQTGKQLITNTYYKISQGSKVNPFLANVPILYRCKHQNAFCLHFSKEANMVNRKVLLKIDQLICIHFHSYALQNIFYLLTT